MHDRGEGAKYRDTGENGMFVYLVVPYKSKDKTILYSAPFSVLENQILVGMGKDAEDWYSPMELEGAEEVKSSIQLLACILIGSTKASLFNESTREYWYAVWDDLTDGGRLLFSTMRELYKVEPTLLTFLDT